VIDGKSKSSDTPTGVTSITGVKTLYHMCCCGAPPSVIVKHAY